MRDNINRKLVSVDLAMGNHQYNGLARLGAQVEARAKANPAESTMKPAIAALRS